MQNHNERINLSLNELSDPVITFLHDQIFVTTDANLQNCDNCTSKRYFKISVRFLEEKTKPRFAHNIADVCLYSVYVCTYI